MKIFFQELALMPPPSEKVCSREWGFPMVVVLFVELPSHVHSVVSLRLLLRAPSMPYTESSSWFIEASTVLATPPNYCPWCNEKIILGTMQQWQSITAPPCHLPSLHLICAEMRARHPLQWLITCRRLCSLISWGKWLLSVSFCIDQVQNQEAAW